MRFENVEFSYNTSQIELVMPEYGRNIQDMILFCKSIEDPIYRQHFADAVIDLMHIITPYNKNMDEHRTKLWHHFFRIAEYNINVIPNSGIIPTPDDDKLSPDQVPYPSGTDKYRHYGNYVNQLIKKALEMEPGPKREAFSHIIGSYMKMAFKNWNKEHYVSDDLIKNDLILMSGGQLKLDDDVQFNTLVDSQPRNQKRTFRGSHKQNYKNKKGGGMNKHRNSNSNNNRRRG
jgi:Domain of unknown function (DUF4290)